MSPTPEELQLGEQSYRRVCNYEKNSLQSFRPQLGVLVIMFGILAVFVLIPDHSHRLHDYSELAVVVMPIAAVGMFTQYRATKESYAQGKLLLQLLKEKYGETLPWIVEEKQLARAGELEAEIAKAQSADHA